MLNITRIIDEYGWAFHFITKDMSTFSKCRVIPQKWNNINYNLQDILVICGPNISYKDTAINIPKICKEKGIKTIGMMCGESKVMYEGVDLIVAVSPQTYLYAKEMYKGKIPVIFLPEGIDCGYFSQLELKRNRFTPGWCGGYKGKPFKRAHLLAKLKYPGIIQSEHGRQYFVENRTQENVKEFYSSIDCFVNLSITEVMPRVMLESMACGLPIISTDVGAVQLMIPDEWIIPLTDEEQTIIDTNKKLEQLASSFELREAMGKINRAWAENIYDWSNIMPIYDEVFYYLKEGNFTKIEEIGERVIFPFKKYFQPCDKYKEQISHFSSYKVEQRATNIPTVYDNSISSLAKELSDYSGSYWIAAESCLETINKQKITKDKVYLGINNYNDKNSLISYLKSCGAYAPGTDKYDLNFGKIEIIINLEGIYKTKDMPLCGYSVKVPYPVVPYLQERFGIDWKNK